MVTNMERREERARRNARMSRGDRIFGCVNAGILWIISISMLYPLLYVIAGSFSDPLSVVQSKIVLLPQSPTLAAYERVFRNEMIMSGYRNTILYTLLGTAVNVVITLMTAYPLSRPDLAGKKIVNSMIAFTMLFSGGMVPTFLVVKSLGLMDTVWAVILPGAMSAWNMFIVKNYYMTSIPRELIEAADVDGASDMCTYLKIVTPLSAPIVAVMVLYYGVAHWNAYFDALLYLRDKAYYPLQLVIRTFVTAADYAEQGGGSGDTAMLLINETMKYALIVIASAPILCLYPLLQRYFIKGVMLGAIKG